MTMSITHHDRFPLRSTKHFAGTVIDAQHTHLDTSTLWTVHLRGPENLSALNSLAMRALAQPLDFMTGEFVGGDSFAEWAEPYNDAVATDMNQPGRALHMEFTAPDLDTAKANARILTSLLGETYRNARNVTLSTAGDWAEQAEIWL